MGENILATQKGKIGLGEVTTLTGRSALLVLEEDGKTINLEYSDLLAVLTLMYRHKNEDITHKERAINE